MRFLIVCLLCINTAWARNEPSVLLYNSVSGHVIVSQNVSDVRPLASITKLMTAIVALETGYGLDRSIRLNKSWGGILPVRSYTRRELLTAMLIRSDNSAAETLAEDYPGGRSEFIREMNDRAQRMGMSSTRFDDASGLSANNLSSAQDIRILLTEAAKWDVIRQLSTTQHTEIVVPGRKKPVKVAVNNTNTPLLGTFGNSTVVSKTGLTSRAGFCVAMMLEDNQQQYYVVVLGAKTKAERTKIVERTVLSMLEP